ncbi:MAG: PKD domain-containing protein, partial [Chlamydiia bacterium]|nr:PKD domain-containing protein [Chlamydiia bacterium]
FSTSCNKDGDGPTAGFTLDPESAVQYDVVKITSTSNSTDISYEISGGEATVNETDNTVMFLEVATYTITQTAKNSDGSTTATETIEVGAVVNSYKMTYYGDDQLFVGDAYWGVSNMTRAKQIRINGVKGNLASPDVVKAEPVAGLDPLEGSYTWAADGSSRTYNAEFTHYSGEGSGPRDADAWMMHTIGGDGVEITLLVDATDEANKIYKIKMMNTSFSGYYAPGFQEVLEPSVLSFTYIGKITPLPED